MASRSLLRRSSSNRGRRSVSCGLVIVLVLGQQLVLYADDPCGCRKTYLSDVDDCFDDWDKKEEAAFEDYLEGTNKCQDDFRERIMAIGGDLARQLVACDESYDTLELQSVCKEMRRLEATLARAAAEAKRRECEEQEEDEYKEKQEKNDEELAQCEHDAFEKFEQCVKDCFTV